MVCIESDVITSDICAVVMATCVVVVETSKTTTIEVYENDLTVSNLSYSWGSDWLILINLTKTFVGILLNLLMNHRMNSQL